MMNLSVAAQKLMKADLHGCPASVRKSKCPSYVGTSGIIIQETRNMFVMVTPSDEIKSKLSLSCHFYKIRPGINGMQTNHIL